MRPPWDKTWMDIAIVMSRRTPCVRAACGAVIVDTQNRIVATGYNGPPANLPHTSGPCGNWCQRGQEGPTPATVASYADCPAIHAEANALMFVDRRHSEGGTLYVTSVPCFSCAKLVSNSGLKRVVYLDEGDTRSYREPDNAIAHLGRSGLRVVRMNDERTTNGSA